MQEKVIFNVPNVPLSQVTQIAQDFLKALQGKRIILCLEGNLGVGKTEFVKCLLQVMGCDQVSSPSFSIIQSYQTATGSVEHVDLYRLENEDDLESSGFWDLFHSSEGFVIIEWPERLNTQYLPKTWRKYLMKIKISQQQGRNFTLLEL